MANQLGKMVPYHHLFLITKFDHNLLQKIFSEWKPYMTNIFCKKLFFLLSLNTEKLLIKQIKQHPTRWKYPLMSYLNLFQANADKISSTIIPQKINNERDLYRVYAKSQKDMPTVINVDIDITFLEALSKFKVNYELDDFVVLNVAKQTGSPFR